MNGKLFTLFISIHLHRVYVGSLVTRFGMVSLSLTIEPINQNRDDSATRRVCDNSL